MNSHPKGVNTVVSTHTHILLHDDTALEYAIQRQDLSDFTVLGKKGDEVSLLLQAEQKR
jgi:hypothetical protein